jgi:hypothetical protein
LASSSFEHASPSGLLAGFVSHLFKRSVCCGLFFHLGALQNLTTPEPLSSLQPPAPLLSEAGPPIFGFLFPSGCGYTPWLDGTF